MTKLVSSVGLAILFMLAGCQLYFGDHRNSGGGNGDGNPPGFQCNGDKQCAPGCFCNAQGICAEAGFCGNDKDCGNGFHCDMARSSCVPNPACTANEQCSAGSMCDGKTCVVTCRCTSDADAIRQGAGWCDEARSTCMPGADPKGACLGDITCTTPAPGCPEGQVALRKDGCFTGECRAIAACEGPPTCNALTHQNDCGARTDCSIVTTGHGCRRSDGSACQPGDSPDVCKCDSYTFSACETKTTPVPRTIFE